MTSPGPAFQECTRSCHENVPAPKAVSSDQKIIKLRFGVERTDGRTEVDIEARVRVPRA